MELRSLPGGFGAEVLAAELSKPLAAEDGAFLRNALAENSILLVRGQNIAPQQQIDFTRGLGDLEYHVLKQFCLREHPEIYVLSNVKENGQYIGANNAGEDWHSDSSFLSNPSLGSALRAIEVPPEGGETGFAGMYEAYDALPATMKKRIDGLRAVHSFTFFYSTKTDRPPLTEDQKKKVPDVSHPIVRTNRHTGRKALYVCQSLCPRVEGMPADEGRDLILELHRHATGPQFQYVHRYDVGDIMIWDNRSSMHRAMPYDSRQYRRVMHRTTVVGDGPPI